MSHNIINKITIQNNKIKIKINEKINNMTNENLIELYCICNSVCILELNKGNEYDKVWLKLTYSRETLITEYINIFKIVRMPTLYDFIQYFCTINERFDSQNTETNINIDDYLHQTNNISQEISIIMIFDVLHNKKEITEMSKKLYNLLKIDGANERIFKIVNKNK